MDVFAELMTIDCDATEIGSEMRKITRAEKLLLTRLGKSLFMARGDSGFIFEAVSVHSHVAVMFRREWCQRGVDLLTPSTSLHQHIGQAH